MRSKQQSTDTTVCGFDHFNRRTLLKVAGFSGLGWLTPVAESLAVDRGHLTEKSRPNSVIVLWMAGGPSQLETFDPHPGTNIAAGTMATATSVPGIRLAKGLEQIAEEMDSIAIVRSVVSKEGDHERATYNAKTGFRPDSTLQHPSIGAILCHQLPRGNTEIPRHVSILSGNWPSRGGYLGNQFDAFKAFDPQEAMPDIQPRVNSTRARQRVRDIEIVNRAFEAGRLENLEQRTLHQTTTDQALRMMSSEQLKAFDIQETPKSLRTEFGDSPFGRACLAAARLTEVGVRCVEVTLSGWDSHIANHDIHATLTSVLDPAMAALIRYLRDSGRLADTLVLWGGEFGRTPSVNPAGGRDHWPHGFSIALAGGGIQGGQVIGETDPEGSRLKYSKGIPIADIHATVLQALGIEFQKEIVTPVGRPMKLSEGHVIRTLLG